MEHATLLTSDKMPQRQHQPQISLFCTTFSIFSIIIVNHQRASAQTVNAPNSSTAFDWINIFDSGILDAIGVQWFTVDDCPAPMEAFTCVRAPSGCTEGKYCPYGNFPVDALANDVWDNINCTEERSQFDCCDVNASTGFVECMCSPGFYCPRNTSQPRYCFAGYYCPTPSTIFVCPEDHYCPLATISPLRCFFLESCPVGSDTPLRYGLLGLLLFAIFLLFCCFHMRNECIKSISQRRVESGLNGIEEDDTRSLKLLEQCIVRDPYFWRDGSFNKDAERHLRVRQQRGTQLRDKTILTDHQSRLTIYLNPSPKSGQRRASVSSQRPTLPDVLSPKSKSTKRRSSIFSLTTESAVDEPRRAESGYRAPAPASPKRGSKVFDQQLHFSSLSSPIADARASNFAIPPDSPVSVNVTDFDTRITNEIASDTMTDGTKKHSTPYNIAFNDLVYKLPDTGVAIVEGLTGEFRAGRLCAIMGPSGSGKTSAIDLVCGKKRKASGTISLNNNFINGLQAWKEEVGFVPQEDIMHRRLTVRQVITFSAQLRVPREWTIYDIENHVEWILNHLELTSIQNHHIGDSKKRGISGGQRKRVNIGIELAGFPSVLFLDEPTSGLDSSTAVKVTKMLKKLATHHNLTVVAVIHAPTPQVFEFFDDILLLQKGGRTGYCGKITSAIEVITKKFQYAHKKDNEADADYLLSVVSNEVYRRPSQQELLCAEVHEVVTMADMFDAFNATKLSSVKELDGLQFHRMNTQRLRELNAHRHVNHLLALSKRSYVKRALYPAESFFKKRFHCILRSAKQTEVEQGAKAKRRKISSYWTQYCICFTRAINQHLSSFSSTILDLAVHFVLGLVLAIPLASLKYAGPFPRIVCQTGSPVMIPACEAPLLESFTTGATTIGLAVCFAGVASSIYTFGDEQPVYWRECQAGLLTAMYFLGKLTCDVIRILLVSTSFYGGFVFFYTSLGSSTHLYIIVLAFYTFGWSMGYILSNLTSVDKAAMYGVGAAVFWCILLGGITPSLEDVEDFYPGFSILLDLSGPRWLNEAFFINEMEFYRNHPYDSSLPYINTTSTFERWRYSPDNFGKDIRWGFLLSAGWIVIACLGLFLTSKDKKK